MKLLQTPRGVTIVDEVKGRATEKLNLIAGLLNNEVIALMTYDYGSIQHVAEGMFNPDIARE